MDPGEPVMPKANPKSLRPDRTHQFSPGFFARVGGLLYLIIIAAGLFAEVVSRGRLIVPFDPAQTASNISAHQTLYRLGIAADVSTFLTAIVVTVILYSLLKGVNGHVALAMVFFNLVQDAIGGINILNTYRPIQLLGDASYLDAFSPDQLRSLALLALKTHAFGFGIALLFFGPSCLALGYLVFKSGFFPRLLGY